MIIWGTTTLKSTAGQGVFHCPTCSTQQGYRVVKASGFFTLYFIPLIPLGERGRYVECNACGGTYAEAILSYDPVREQAEAEAAALRLLVGYMIINGRTGSQDVFACQRACSEVFDRDIPSDLIKTEIQHGQAAPSLSDFIKTTGATFHIEGRLVVLKAAKKIAEADGRYTTEDRESLKQFGKLIGFEAAHIDQVMAAIER